MATRTLERQLISGPVKLTVELGEEMYRPLEFHTIKLGRLSVELEVHIENESALQEAIETVRAELRAAQEKEFEDQKKRFARRTKELNTYLRRSRER